VPLPFGMRSRFDTILDASSSVEHATRTDDAGRFELGGVPLFDGARLVTAQGGYVTDTRALPAYDELSLEIVLSSARDDRDTLLGNVIDAADKPVEGAWVAVGTNAAKSGPDGAFALDLVEERGRLAQPDPKQATRITAVKAGHLPGELTRAAADAWPEPLVLRLGEAPLVIDGRVVDAEGKPVAKAQVWTTDETHFGYIELDGGESTMRFGSTIEGILRGDPFEHRVRTNGAGRFELGGLVARDYRVHVLDPKTMCATTVTFAGGARNVEIRMPKEDVHARVAGRVTSLSGEPIAGLLVHLQRRTVSGFELERVDGGMVTTDAEGRFAFVNVSRALSSIHVLGEQIGLGGFERAIAPDDDVEHLELRVPMRVHVQIEASGRTDLEWASIVDEKGSKLELGILHGSHAYATQDMRLEAGRSEAFSVSETAKELVLYAKGAEVQRVKLALEHGQLNVIRP
jgi:protocatechuate 3,4-dioxygenase beta subunit